MLRFSPDCIKHRVHRGHGILELCRLVVHDRFGSEATNVVEIGRSGSSENVQFCLFCQLHCIRANISSRSVD